MSPERFNSELLLTTSQVAEFLDVHASTVKRWCNEGELEFGKTGGGHRRIHLEDAVALARGKKIPNFLTPFTPYEGHVWSAVAEVVGAGSWARVRALAMGWLMRGRTDLLARLFFELGRNPDVPFPAFCDDGIGGFMREVGEAWCDGRLRVGDEHILSETLVEVLVELRAEARRNRSGDGREVGLRPLAVLGAMEGDRHSLGARCVRLVLEDEGWEVAYLGADVPIEDFAAVQTARGASLVGVSFAPPSTPADMRRCVRVLTEFYDPDRPYALVFGGGITGQLDFSDLTPPFLELAAFDSVSSFHERLRQGLGTARHGG